MKKNILLFTWEGKFLLDEKLDRRKKIFKEKYWQNSVYVFNSENADSWLIRNIISSWNLFDEKKLIILNWFPKDSYSWNFIKSEIIEEIEKYFSKNLKNISSENVIIFVSYKVDKRTKFYKFLKSSKDIVEIEEFKKLSLTDIKKNVKSFLQDLNPNINLIDYFINKVGSDLYSLKLDADKLNSYCKTNKLRLDKNIIDLVVFSNYETNAFEVLDNVFFNKKKTYILLDELKNQGLHYLQVLWMVYWWFRNIIQMLDLYILWDKDSKSIASKLWLAPFVVSKNISVLPKIVNRKKYIHKTFEQLINLDFSIKSWLIPVESFYIELKKIISYIPDKY